MGDAPGSRTQDRGRGRGRTWEASSLEGTTTEAAQGTRFLDDADPRYMELTREVACDADGNFRLGDVPDGDTSGRRGWNGKPCHPGRADR